MRILVTGGAGFIGSHLCERLLQDGHEVIALDNFNHFYDPAIKRRNVEAALTDPAYSLVEGDILDTACLETVVDSKLDAVVHQRVNIEGTLNLLEACRRRDVRRFVFASSSSVYGGRSEVPFCETDNVMNPISPYAATKVAGEALCYTYHHLFGIQVNALRFFTVYGPRQRPEMAIHMFADRILKGEEITLFGDGESSRDYTYISDIIDGITAAIDRCDGCAILNLGGSTTTSLNRLVALIGARLGRTPLIRRLPDQPGDVPITYADVSSARSRLDYCPKVGIKEGIARTCDWLKQK
jgi:UDP-glucuronate 4-epimerase